MCNEVLISEVKVTGIKVLSDVEGGNFEARDFGVQDSEVKRF